MPSPVRLSVCPSVRPDLRQPQQQQQQQSCVIVVVGGAAVRILEGSNQRSKMGKMSFNLARMHACRQAGRQTLYTYR